MVCLGNEQRSFCRFWDCIQVLHFRLFVDHDGYSISSKGFLPTVVDIISATAYNITILSLNPIICKENCLPIGVLWENITGKLLDPIGRAARLKERRPPPWGQNLCLYLTLYTLSLGAWPRALHLVNSQQVLLSKWLCEVPLTKIFTRKVLKLFLLIWIKIPER